MRRAAIGLGAAVLVAGAAVGCATPSRHLTSRAVEDPIVLPRRLASVSVEAFAMHFEPNNAEYRAAQLGFRYGITDRLEWVDLLSLRYAFLDDRPADGRAPMPLSLALRAGLRGIGYSSAEGAIVLPIVSLDVLRHVGDRWALSLSGGWEAIWKDHPPTFVPMYSAALVYQTNDWSSVAATAAATRQLTERVAAGLSATLQQATACVDPTCGWKSRGAGASLHLIIRPWHWLPLRVAPGAGVRARPDAPLPTTGPDGPIVVPPRRVEWIGLFGWAEFYW